MFFFHIFWKAPKALLTTFQTIAGPGSVQTDVKANRSEFCFWLLCASYALQ